MYPYTKRYLGSFENHFSKIGLIGMNEVGLNATWLKADLTDERVQRFLSRAPLPRLGKLSMGIFVIHTPVFCLLRSSLFSLMLNRLPNAVTYPLCFCLGIILTLLGAWILHWAYDSVSGARRRQTVSAR